MQLIALLALSTVQWSRHALTLDFAAYAQALWLIGHGHLDPYSSVLGYPFLRNNGELIMWPLALLARLGAGAIALLWVQDLALVATGYVTLRWIRDVLDGSPRLGSAARSRLWWIAVAAVLLDPSCYQTALFDFHSHALGALFAVLAGRDLWRLRRRRALVWGVLLGMTGTVGVLALVGIGLSGLLHSRRTRPAAAAMVGAGVIWLLVLVELRAAGGGGHMTATTYRYLDPSARGQPPVTGLVAGLFIHWPAVAHRIAAHAGSALALLIPAGLVGVASRLAIGPVAAVFLPAMLTSWQPSLALPHAYQVWPAIAFVLVASVQHFARWSSAAADDVRAPAPTWNRVQPVTARRSLLGAWALVLSLSTVTVFPGLPSYWMRVSPAARSALDELDRRIPPGAEVIASQGIAGRFADRRWVFAVMQPVIRLPVRARTVVFVLAPDQGILGVAPPATDALIKASESLPRTRVLDSGGGVTAILWHPPLGAGQVILPIKGN